MATSKQTVSATEQRGRLSTDQRFVGRRDEIVRFVDGLVDAPDFRPVLYYCAEPGAGKTRLLHFLQACCCRDFDPAYWQQLREADDGLLVDTLAQPAAGMRLPAAVLDFAMPARGIDRPQDPYYGPLMIRRALAEARLQFPLYDFASLWYAHCLGESQAAALRDLLPADVSYFADELADTLSAAQGDERCAAATDLIRRHFTEHSHVRGLTEADVARILDMPLEQDLHDRLAVLLAEDLRTSLRLDGAPSRVVLMFDAHDAFWAVHNDLSDPLFFQRDEWLRGLIAALGGESSVCLVLAGREAPRWSEAGVAPIPREWLELRRLGGLSAVDAARFLKAGGWGDSALHASIVDCARQGADEVNALHLRLCADLVNVAAQGRAPLTATDFRGMAREADKTAYLTDRLLQRLDNDMRTTLRALAVCHAFDGDLLAALGSALGFDGSAARLDKISGLSLVDARDGTYRIHELVRGQLTRHAENVARRAHAAMEHYFDAKAIDDGTALTEAIYHASQVEPERGAERWRGALGDAMAGGDHALCRLLFAARRDMAPVSIATTAQMDRLQGDCLAAMGRHEHACQVYREAVTGFDQACDQEPDSIALQNAKGLVFRRLGELQAGLGQYDGARMSYKLAVVTFESLIDAGIDSPVLQHNMANALACLGELHAACGERDEAIASYSQAVNAYRQVEGRLADPVPVLSNKVRALEQLGRVRVDLGQYEAAMSDLVAAASACDEMIARRPSGVQALGGKAVAMRLLSKAQAAQSLASEATTSLKQAVELFDAALEAAPRDEVMLLEKGKAMRQLAQLRRANLQHTDALAALYGAVGCIESALGLGHRNVAAWIEESAVLQEVGDLERRLSRRDKAVEAFGRAVQAADEALACAPRRPAALGQKAAALQALGRLLAHAGRSGEAMERYHGALAALDELLSQAPGEAANHRNKGLVLRLMGDVQAGAMQQAEALSSYRQALAALDGAGALDADDVSTAVTRCVTLQSLAKMQTELSQTEEAMASYRRAVAAADEALRRTPDQSLLHKNKGVALAGLGMLEVAAAPGPQAMADLGEALEALARALQLAPGDRQAAEVRSRVEELLKASNGG
jgi:tetratricopeptide (TPR) repeat protein